MGLKVVEYGEIYPANLHNISSIAITIQVYEAHSDSIKPILFPLSAIKRKIKVNGEKVIVAKLLTSDIRGVVVGLGRIAIPIEPVVPLFDTFHRYHIDYRGLIDKGLAISVFDLSENPYK